RHTRLQGLEFRRVLFRSLPPVTDKPMTNRDRLAVHLTNQSCAGCHSLIDPIGYGLEGFDNIGRARDKLVLRIQQQRDAVTNAEQIGRASCRERGWMSVVG